MFNKLSETKYSVTGKVSWAMVFKPDHRLKFQSKDQFEDVYRLDLEMSPDDMNHLMMLRINKDIKQDFRRDKKTGQLAFQFRRYAAMTVPANENEEAVPTNPPLVVDAQGKPMDGTDLIGNGSECEISFILDPINKAGTAHKIILNGVKVLNLLPYEATAQRAAPPVDVDCFASGSDTDIPF